jgi:putative ABC transport system permease protein
MAPGIPKIVIKSVRFFKKSVIYQLLIVALLSAVITGSLLTGWSVRASLKQTASEHLGNTGILISSGSRFFDLSLADRLIGSSRINCTGLLEINGFCQNLNTQKGVLNAHIYSITQDFFKFHGSDTFELNPGEAAINEKLATDLDLKMGDELIIRFNEISDIPSDAPFAPSSEEGRSIALKVGAILTAAHAGNFSLSINQIVPENVFVNLSDININPDKQLKINRLLIDKKSNITEEEAHVLLKKIMKPADLGIKILPVSKTGGSELRSARIFIENTQIKEIENIIPSASPVITYLGNRISHGKSSAPYSFISALPHSLYPEIVSGNEIIINRWLSEDLSVRKGDTLIMSWYAPDSLNKLIEKKGSFFVSRIVGMKGIWGDSLLMPDFPGISGKESCSDWDAGVPVKLNDIRKKDEEYWNKYRGTPKAFINYDKGVELWGNNFGPATAMRFPPDISVKEIVQKLSGNLDPSKNGFTITNLSDESLKAASESVDFSTLFLSLGFFLILASLVLLSFAVTNYLESKHSQIRIFFALGFRSRWIQKLFMTESALISVAGCFIGSFAGILVSILIIKLLNTVWQGAVQTDTLSAYFGLTPVFTGFLLTTLIAVFFLMVKIRLHLKNLSRNKRIVHSSPDPGINKVFLVSSFLISVALYFLSRIIKDQEIFFCFGSGSVMLVSMILLWRQYIISPAGLISKNNNLRTNLSGLYYSYYPSHAVTPVLFIAAGIFAVFVTGANRMSFGESQIKPSGGTGGFLLWCDNTIPVKADMTGISGKAAAGLDDDQLSQMHFVQIKRFAANDASCLNLNHVAVPSLLGVDPDEFISRGSFSFARAIVRGNVKNPWEFLNLPSSGNTIYGIADQTVLEWGLKIKPGDTLMMRAENGQKLNIIVAAGLKSSVFQGYVIIGIDNFRKYFPSISGSSIFLIDGNQDLSDLYNSTLNERFENYGIRVEKTNDRLASFYEVTNTYLSVFGIFGALGMVTGIAGLGFVLLRNYNYRRREFALLMATGFKIKRIRRLILSDQMYILLAGIISGVVPAVIANLPSLRNSPDVPWLYLVSMVIAILLAGTTALLLSLKSVTGNSLTASLKKE